MILPLVLLVNYVNIVVERRPGLVEAMCRNERFEWRPEDKVFRMHSTLSYRIARFTHDKQWISLKLPELRTLQYILHMITNTLFMYTDAFCDVHVYVSAELVSCNYVEPTPTAFKSFIDNCLTSSCHLCISNICINKICIRLITCFLFLPCPFL